MTNPLRAATILAVLTAVGWSGPSRAVAASPEIRGTWVTTTGNDDWTSANIGTTMTSLKQVGLNTVYVEAWKNGSTNFNSPTLQAFTGTTSLNPTLGGQILLDDSRKAAAAAGLVHGAWFEYGNMSQFLGNTGTATSGFNALSRKLRDATWTVGTTSGTGMLLRDQSGNYTTSSNGFVWMNPLAPQVRDLIKGIVIDAVTQFDLQIVQFDDHLAWPVAYGWDSYTGAVYKQETGRNLPSSTTDSRFLAWRQEKTLAFFTELSDAVKAVKPSVIVSLAPSTASFSAANYCADWPDWMTKSDEVLPQVYRSTISAFNTDWPAQITASGTNVDELGAGLRLLGTGSSTPWNDLRQQIDRTRTDGALGHSIWYSNGISNSGTNALDNYNAELTAYYGVSTNGIAANPHFQSTRWSGTGGNGGSGTWSQIASQWKDTSTIWVSSGTGIFDGVGGTVTISGSVMAEKGLDFRTTGYTVTGGTLAFRGVSRADNLVNVASGATTTLAAIVTGSTGLTKAGAGTLSITGSASGLTGGIQIDAGTLRVGSGGTAGSLNTSTPIIVASGGTLAFNRSDTYGGNVANVISGSGGVTLLSGSLGLSGSNTYGGGTLVRGGTLSLVAGGAINHAAGDVTLGSTAGDVATLALTVGTITGSNGIVGSGSGARGVATVAGGTWSSLNAVVVGQSGSGSLVLSGSGRVSVGGGSGTITLARDPLSTGTLTFASGLTSGTLHAATVTGGSGSALVLFQQPGTYVVQPVLSGSLALTQSGSGAAVLAAANTYAGTTTISSGTLQVGGGGTTGVIGSGAVVNNGALVFNRTDDYGGPSSANATRSLTGSGSVQLLAGSLTLSGSNTHAGGTLIRGGTLALAPTGVVSHGAADVVVGGGVGDAGFLSLPAGMITGSSGILGSGSGATGVASVSGSGSWTSNGSLTVGSLGTGTLTIADAGLVRVGGTAGTGTLTLASAAGSRGTLSIGAGGGLIGRLEAGVVTGGAGTATVNFNHTSGSFAFDPRLAGALSVNHAGPGRTLLGASNTFTGPTTVAQGVLELGNPGALASSAVTVAAGATLAVGPQVQATVPALFNNGLVDIGLGGLTVASGQTAGGIAAAIVAGRADGAWTGTSGITSSAAAAQSERAVGWLDNGDGSFTVSFAAAGDLNVNGVVDFDDVILFVGAGLFDSGLPATWIEGDYDYNGVVDFDDVLASVAAGLFDAGEYNQAPAGAAFSAGVAAVPEPATWVLVALGAACAVGWRRRQRVSPWACRRP